MLPLDWGALETSGPPRPGPLALVSMTSAKIVSVLSGPAKGLRPLTHGTPRETHILKRAKIELKPIEEQPVEEVKEESCQDGSDTEDSSSSQSSQHDGS